MRTLHVTSKRIGFAAILALLSASSSWAAGGVDSDVFARLLARVQLIESMSAGKYVLTRSNVFKELGRAILGEDAAGLTDEQVPEAAIRKLQRNGEFRLAQNLERRVSSIEEDFAFEMGRDPGSDMEALLNRLSAERLQSRWAGEGSSKHIEFKEKVQSTAEKELAEALKADPDLAALRKAVTHAAASAPDRKLEEALAAYDRLILASPELAALLPKDKVLAQFADLETVDFTENLKSLVARLEKAPAGQTPEVRLRNALRFVLADKVPAESIAARAQALAAGERDAFKRALGDMTLGETRELFFGADPLHPSPKSLLGRYLEETGATTAIRTFNDYYRIDRGESGAQGAPRLVVSISKNTLPTFLKYFKSKQWTSVFNHAFMVHDGEVTTFHHALSPFQVPSTEYTPFPMVVLKPTEGQRMAQYLELFRKDPQVNGFDSKASGPWNLGPGYCARSAWAAGCTQHIGNIPIGDTRVIGYTMPGNGPGVDAFNPAPNFQIMKPYEHASEQMHRIWKVPGNMQFGETIGLQGANLRGELANPGWLIWSLVGAAPAERVPVVFVARPDHLAPINPTFVPNIEHRF